MASSGSFNTTAYSGRYLTFAWTETMQSVANNITTISWTLKGAGGDSTWYYARNIKVTIAGVTVYSYPESQGKIQLKNGTLVASGSWTFTHNDDGTKNFTASAEAGIYTYAVNCTGSSTFTLDTIARASQPSLITWPENTQDVGDFGSTISIHMNRKSSDFTHTVRYEFGELSGTIATGVTTGTTWTIPLSLMNQIPNSTYGSGRVYVDTYKGSTLVGTKYSGFTATVPASVAPACSITWEDITGLKGTYGNPVQGLSKIGAKVITQAAYSSPIKSYSITIEGVKYGSSTATTGFLTKSGTSAITATVVDSRGRSRQATTSMTVLAYAKPTVTKLAVHRCDSDGTENENGDYIKATFIAAVSSLNAKNTASYVLKYKKSSVASYTSVTLTALANNYSPTNYDYVFAADSNSSYDVAITATDRYASETRNTSASTAFTLMNFHPSGSAIGIGKVAEKENALDIALNVQGRAWGLGTLELIPNSSDLNLYTVPGVYSIATDAAAGTMKNMPKAVAGRLVISDSTGTEPAANALYEYKEQLFLPHDIGRGGMPWVRQIRRAGSAAWTYYAWQSFALFAYPVGAIYIAYNHESPADLFGGTWVRIVNRFLWACDADGEVGILGGEKTHTLTVNELPVHSHGSVYSQHAGPGQSKNYAWYNTYGTNMGYGPVEAGGGQAHNNMPPYVQVSMWQRTG
jgi:hypothetical protein